VEPFFFINNNVVPIRSTFTHLIITHRVNNIENSSKVSYIVFFCTLTVVLLTLTAMVFPALFSSYFGLYTENLEPFELGHQSIFLITSNVIIFGLGILYYKKKIPSTLNNAIEKVLYLSLLVYMLDSQFRNFSLMNLPSGVIMKY